MAKLTRIVHIVKRAFELAGHLHTLIAVATSGFLTVAVGVLQAILHSRPDLVLLGALFVASSLMTYVAMRRAASTAAVAIGTPTPQPREAVVESQSKEVPKQLPSGVVSAAELRTWKTRMPGEVYAVELLTQPVKLTRNANRKVTVAIDRSGVEEMIISNKGKMAAVESYVTKDNINKLRFVDKQIHKFLVGDDLTQRDIDELRTHGTTVHRPNSDNEEVMIVDLQALGTRLRWASGGVLSIVTDSRGDRWVPLFFRDIRPYGWNTALGVPERWFNPDGSLHDTEKSEELSDPRNYIWREFLEEMLIVTSTPQSGGTVIQKYFDPGLAASAVLKRRWKEFDDDHCRLRMKEDELNIREEIGHVTQVTLNPVGYCSVQISVDKGPKSPTDNVLVCFSLLDLGIEVVEVAEYNLDPNDYILDGEIKVEYDPEIADGEDRGKELVRMPVALFSLGYLERCFGSKDWSPCRTRGPQPSFEVPQADAAMEGEIRLYPYDVRRRMKAIDREWGEDEQRRRFLEWYDRFCQNFIEGCDNGEGDPWTVPESPANPSRLFVPATARILNLYFRCAARMRDV